MRTVIKIAALSGKTILHYDDPAVKNVDFTLVNVQFTLVPGHPATKRDSAGMQLFAYLRQATRI